MSVKPRLSRLRPILLSLSIAASPFAVVTIATTTTTGCGVFGSGGPSLVGQGKLYRTQDPTFDEYFAALYELQVELAKAPDDERDIRRELAKELQGDPDASGAMLAKRIDKRAKELAEAGTGLKLELRGLGEGSAAAEVSSAGEPLDSSGNDFANAVKKSVVAMANLHNRMRKAQLLLERLQGLTPTLEQQVDNAFRRSVSQKGEVRKNLADAKKLLPIMAVRANEVAESTSSNAKRFVEAISTDDGSFDKPPPPPPPPPEEELEEPPAKPGDKPKPKPKPKPPVDGPKPPPPPPPPPPKPPGDFEP